MIAAEQLEVRPLEGHEVEAVERRFPSSMPYKHRDRLSRQQRGDVVYLIAWVERRPVGHALVKLKGASSEPIATHSGHCPYIEDLLVAQEWRSQGIGSQLLEEAERLARERGFGQIGLSVVTENVRARRLYERRGYVESGLGRHPMAGSRVDADGKVRRWADMSLYLVKKLT